MALNVCRDAEGWGPVSRERPFDLTLCFEEGILQSVVLLVFGIWSLISAGVLWKRPTRERTRKSTWILRAKLTLLTLGGLASLANVALVYGWQQGAIQPSYILEAVAFPIFIFSTQVNHGKGRFGSTSLLLLWPLYAIAYIIWARTVLSYDLRGWIPIVSLKGAIIGLGLISWILELQGPEDLHPPEDETPELTANVYSQWIFHWLTPLLKKGSKEFITADDLPSLDQKDSSANLGDRLYEARQKHKSLWIALASAYGGPFFLAAVLKVLQDILAFLQPQLLKWLLSYISDYQAARFSPHKGGPTPYEGFAIAIIMGLASIAQNILLQQYFEICFRTGMRIRGGLITQIYRKALVLSSEPNSKSSGDIVNLMSVDATKMQELCAYGLIAISGPLQVIFAFVSLYNLLGWSAFVGVAIMVVSTPLNTVIARLLKRMQEQQMKNRDKRTKLMSELLNNIKSIKLYAWEHAFVRKVLGVRNDEELRMLKKLGIVTSFNVGMWQGIPLLVAFASFATAARASDIPLTSDVIFPAISLFMLLSFPLAMFAMVTSSIIEATVSVKRLQDFFASEELHPNERFALPAGGLQKGQEVLSIENADFAWSKAQANPTLEDINLKVDKGDLICIMGRVGCGKTSLLSAIAGDLAQTDGKINVCKSVSYCPQNPWIMSASVRDNICFHHEFDEEFYNTVLDACALRQDLALLKDGDLTEVGEKGIMLSGGQRARVSLARAVYARADLTLLDDVLAAVDSHVARHVFDHVIGPNGLLSTRGRIVVTNSITFASQFDRLVFIRRGVILEQATFADCMANENSEIKKLIAEYGQNGGSGGGGSRSGTSTPFHHSGTQTPVGEKEEGSPKEPESPAPEYSEKDMSRLYRSITSKNAKRAIPPTVRATIATGPSKEHTEQGKVQRSVYIEYLKAASRTGFIGFLLATGFSQVLSFFGTYTLKQWGEANRDDDSDGAHFGFLLYYGLFSLLSIVTSVIGAIMIWVLCTIRSAQSLHDAMLHSVVRSPLSFFEMTPTGRILNLFSKDTYVVDQVMARVIRSLVSCLAVVVTIFIVIGVNFPWFLVVVPPMSFLYLRVMKYYLSTSRELKRIDAVSKSPIFSWFGESIAGTSTIRAFGQQDVFIATNDRRIDLNQMAYIPSMSVNRWLATRLEFLGSAMMFVATILSIVALITTGVDAGLVGLVLSYATNIQNNLNWLVRMASEVEQNIVSVERILHYINLEPEAPYEIPDEKPKELWPSAGRVEFQNYSTRYRPELDLVLRDISIDVKPREKIGVVGRTGAGKSSLLLALFRIIEPSSGTIIIDGVDIKNIGLHDLRSNVSIVPQQPDLFEGTMRENIDPVGEHQDADIWVALDQSGLKEYVEGLPQKLDAPVREGGSSLSSGQRQLLCFARALLRKSKVLVLDEATSAVDLETDKAVQEIIRGPVFADVTMFIIAHRLNTVIDSDRILVMSEGKVAEFDTPKALLAKSDSIFRSMATEAGIFNSEEDGSA